jgi:FlaA1/EpsC-like NDP-sugar epimerase
LGIERKAMFRLFQRGRRRVLILGTGEKAKEVAREILSRRIPGFQVAGFVGNDPRDVGVSILNPCIVGTYDELPDVIRRERVGCVVVAEDDRRRLCSTTSSAAGWSSRTRGSSS